MLYAFDITIPANTLEATPTTEELKLCAGRIKKIEVKFPSGCHGMVKTRLFRGIFQLLPLSSGEWLIGDDEPVSCNYNYQLDTAPLSLVFKGCSPSTTYEHTITVRIELERDVADKLESINEHLANIEGALT